MRGRLKFKTLLIDCAKGWVLGIWVFLIHVQLVVPVWIVSKVETFFYFLFFRNCKI